MEEQELITRAREEIEKRTGKTPEHLYAERERRIVDAIQLKEPDRVPVFIRVDYFAPKYAGVPASAMFYDQAAYKRALAKTLVDFDADVCYVAGNCFNRSGRALEVLDAKQIKWPGGSLPHDGYHQYLEIEYMQGEEYDLFLTDPTDFVLRCYLPRVLGALEPFSRLPNLGPSLVGSTTAFLNMTPIFNKPEFQNLAGILSKAGEEEAKFTDWENQMRQLGSPPATYSGGIGTEPFDLFASYLRGMRGVMVDMFRRPEKLLAACQKVLEWRMVRAVPADPKSEGYPRRVGGGGSHYVHDRALSKKQFETFAWPTWKRALQATIDMGFIPTVFGEAKTDDRLEYMLEFPRGKVCCQFQEVDVARAKSILNNHCSLQVIIPGTLLQIGSNQEVEDYTKNIVKVCGKGGGLMIVGSVLDDARPDNVKTMVETVKKYGKY